MGDKLKWNKTFLHCLYEMNSHRPNQHRHKKALLICLAMISGAVMANLRNPDVITNMPQDKRTADYIFSDPMIEIMLRHGIAKDRKLGLLPQCDSPYGVEPDSVDFIDPIDFRKGSTHPVKGTWSIRYRLSRCGESKNYNTVFVATGDATAPAAHSYFPGSTNAGTQLIRDTMPAALAAARARSGQHDCKVVDVFDMIVSEPAHQVIDEGKTIEGVWAEKWTFQLCGQLSDVLLRFTPDASNGGTLVKIE